MNKMIAYCGLNCEKCDAYIATKNDDDELREKTAKLWSELNGVEITADMINCEGCRIGGVKTVYCDSLCQIRKCGISRGYETCGECKELETCEKVEVIIGKNKEAKRNLMQG